MGISQESNEWWLYKTLAFFSGRVEFVIPYCSIFSLDIPEIGLAAVLRSIIALPSGMDTTFDHTQGRFILYWCESILKLLEKNSMSGLLKAFFFFIQTWIRTPWLSPEVIRMFWWKVYPLFYCSGFKVHTTK